MAVNEIELRREISDYEDLLQAFEELLKARKRFYVHDDRLATTLCELYATMGAHRILTCVERTNEIDGTYSCEEDENHFETRELLPQRETVQRAGRELVIALASDNKAAALGALIDMGLFALCPSAERMFVRMAFVAERITGHAQQVLLVELARFAARVGDYQRASKYVQQARTFDPNSWELYNIHMVEGLIALNAGSVVEAVQCLALSTTACLAYEKARAQCCIRAPSLELAEKLLHRGEGEAVLRHLSGCKNIWEVLQPQIDNWTRIIKNGGKPDFQATGHLRIPEKPSHTLRMQWMNACALAGGPVSAEVKSAPPKSVAERRAKRERWMTENPRIIDALAARTIADLEKDFGSPPDRSPTDSSKSGQPE